MKLLPLLLLLALAPGLRAAPLERDLGQGLVYWRAHAVPEDLPAAIGRRPCVLDVRYVEGGERAGAELLAWLKAHASPHTPVFLLANGETSGALLSPLNSADAVLGLVVIGAQTKDFEPDLGLKVSASEERKAYEALEHGASVDSLINERVEKVRNDEETLEKAHAEGEDAPDDTDAAPPSPPAKAVPPQLIDASLQRAVQLDRALLALKRLP
ncbi:MAG TPA: hypothetical protein VHV47_13270 [Opitutaceae bacterium]|jgi:hypothetical protein|nr:hypothetical protein [Opitutaceae bacterium]